MGNFFETFGMIKTLCFFIVLHFFGIYFRQVYLLLSEAIEVFISCLFREFFCHKPLSSTEIQIVFSFDIFMTLSPISLLTKSGDNISAHFFSKIPKVTIWRKQQKHWRAKKGCWRMSGIGWTATPWFVILLTTYFTYNFTLYKYFLSMCFFSRKKFGTQKTHILLKIGRVN